MSSIRLDDKRNPDYMLEEWEEIISNLKHLYGGKSRMSIDCGSRNSATLVIMLSEREDT